MLMMIPEAWQNHEAMSAGAAGVLRVPLLADGAVGRPGVDRLHRRHGDRRRARSQRPAPVALLRHQGRPRHHGVRGRRARHPAREHRRQGAAAPGQDVPRRHGAGPHRRRRGDQARARGGAAVRRVAARAPDRHRRPARRAARCREPDHATVLRRQQAFGYTHEDLRLLLAPMAQNGEEPIGSMGTDTALAVLSDRPRLLYDYFKQLFAQVTNPPLDAIREELVTSLEIDDRARGQPARRRRPSRAARSSSSTPSSTTRSWRKLAAPRPRAASRATTLPMLFDPARGRRRASSGRWTSCASGASDAVADGLHDPDPVRPRRRPRRTRRSRACSRRRACTTTWSARARARSCALVVEIGRRARGAPLRAAARLRRRRGQPVPRVRDPRRHDPAGHAAGPRRTRRRSSNYIKALNKGILKVMSKMGISTLQSYCGAQIFEAIGLEQDLRRPYFTWTPSRIERHRPRGGRRGSAPPARRAPTRRAPVEAGELDRGGEYQWRRDGEYHLFNPETVFKLQHATRSRPVPRSSRSTRGWSTTRAARLATLRGLLEFKPAAHAGPARRGRAGRGDRQALRHRRDVATARSARRRTRRSPSR